ncbi:MAG: dihydrofolate reductase [Minisyncoccia bacterium]
MNGITIIVAMDRNRVIGKQGEIPWSGHLRDDMKHFKDYTTGKTVVMGRKTWDSIPPKFKPLPMRENVIMTNDQRFKASDCFLIHSPDAIKSLSGIQEICIIGGAEIYKLFLPMADKLIVTIVDTEVLGGDAFFPEITEEWDERLLSIHKADERNLFPFSIFEYTKDPF